jgi:hypothetical protein
VFFSSPFFPFLMKRTFVASSEPELGGNRKYPEDPVQADFRSRQTIAILAWKRSEALGGRGNPHQKPK